MSTTDAYGTPAGRWSLAGKVAVITGASHGIGAATAELFAAEGASVVLAARDHAALAEVGTRIRGKNGNAATVVCDVGDEVSVGDLFASTRDSYGPPDILINCAGAVTRAAFVDMPADDWDRVQRVNVRGTFLCCRAAFRAMRGRGGVIVNLSSLAGVANVEKFAGNSAYTTSKFAVAGLTEALAVEGRELGIRVLAVSPGAVDTEMLRIAAPHLRADMTPAELARILLFLVGPDARPLAGTNIAIFSNA